MITTHLVFIACKLPTVDSVSYIQPLCLTAGVGQKYYHPPGESVDQKYYHPPGTRQQDSNMIQSPSVFSTCPCVACLSCAMKTNLYAQLFETCPASLWARCVPEHGQRRQEIVSGQGFTQHIFLLCFCCGSHGCPTESCGRVGSHWLKELWSCRKSLTVCWVVWYQNVK